jgi:mersacidin/lichenicidin family type 2 lantibiotic
VLQDLLSGFSKERKNQMNIDIVRAWKDAEYRESLSDEELALLPRHPLGTVELSEEDLNHVVGGGASDLRNKNGFILSCLICSLIIIC